MLLLAFTAITLNSCSKNSGDTNEPSTSAETVKITDSVKIGNQFWATTNYNGQSGVVFNNATTVNPLWGKLYTIEEAKALKLPKGWRLPTTDDFNTLLGTMGARTKGTDGNYISDATVAGSLMAKSNWLTNFPTNTSGFNAVPAGFFTTERNFVEAAGTSDSFISAVFATSSTTLLQRHPIQALPHFTSINTKEHQEQKQQ